MEILERIAEKARADKSFRFTSLYHHLNEESLAIGFALLKKGKASGVDGITIEMYGEKLEENLRDLCERLKTRRYRPQPVRRVFIPKAGSDQMRPLGIPALEDKIVQMAAKRILEAIFEQDFFEFSYGFRPKRSCHDALKELDRKIIFEPVRYVVEADIEKFFDRVSHEWLLRCLEQRVGDPNMLWLVRKFLKSGMMEEGKWKAVEEGTPQGGVLSPLLANIYLHYVLDLWFVKKFQPKARGHVGMVRYADDFIVVTECEPTAQEFLRELRERLSQFGLAVAEAKTRILPFGPGMMKRARRERRTFDFLGFTHYCGRARSGGFMVGRMTARSRFRRSLVEMREWLYYARIQKIRVLWAELAQKMRGHFAYYGVTGNARSLQKWHQQVRNLAFKWLNRRSQRISMTREQFTEYLERHPLPAAILRVHFNSFRGRR